MNAKSLLNALLYIIPTVLFAGFIWLSISGLAQDKQGQPLVASTGKAMPSISLPMLNSKQIFTPSSVKGQKILVNFFASWCKPCIQEHEYLKVLHDALPLPIIGVVYMDKDAAIKKYLKAHGDPFAGIALDRDGRAAIDWGVTGVPETFLIDEDGIILAHSAGPLSIEVWNKFFQPKLNLPKPNLKGAAAGNNAKP